MLFIYFVIKLLAKVKQIHEYTSDMSSPSLGWPAAYSLEANFASADPPSPKSKKCPNVFGLMAP